MRRGKIDKSATRMFFVPYTLRCVSTTPPFSRGSIEHVPHACHVVDTFCLTFSVFGAYVISSLFSSFSLLQDGSGEGRRGEEENTHRGSAHL